MTASQYQSKVSNLDSDIGKLEKKKAALDSDSASLQSKISGIERSITKNTSLSSRNSKMRQIDELKKQKSRKDSASADLGKQIARKKNDRAAFNKKLVDAQIYERKQQERESVRLQSLYEAQISDLQQQLEESLKMTARREILSTEEDSEQRNPQYDVFISHASEDKESFVNELVEELNNLHVRVWIDKDVMAWGDSIRESIDKGLSNSTFGIVVLSPSYIADGKYWTKKELDALFQLETIRGKFILPIWHNLTKKQLIEYSPAVAGKLALSTATMTPQEIAQNVREMLDRHQDEEE